MSPSTKWLAHVHHVVVFKTKVLHFTIENMPIKDKWKEKVQKNAQFPFCGQTKAFCYEFVFRGIQTCFLYGGLECLARFEPIKAARFLKTLEVHFVLYDQRKVRASWCFLVLSTVLAALCSVFNLNNKNVDTLIAHKYWDLPVLVH